MVQIEKTRIDSVYPYFIVEDDGELYFDCYDRAFIGIFIFRLIGSNSGVGIGFWAIPFTSVCLLESSTVASRI